MNRLIVLLSLTVLAAPAALAESAVQIEEWEVPYRLVDGALQDGVPADRAQETRPRDPDVDSQGRVWFVGQAGNYIAHLDPDSGAFTRYELDDGVHPHNLIIDEQDQVWYAGNRASHIGRLDPRSGDIEKFMMPDPDVQDPHTLIWDANGDIWFTAQFSNVVGKLTRSTGQIELVDVGQTRARPYGIVMDSQNNPWIVLFGTNAIMTVDSATMQPRTYTLPDADARPRRLALTSDDMVWYVDYQRGYLGRLDPESADVREWAAPSGDASLPYSMAVDADDRLWFVESPGGNSRFVGFDPESEEFFSITPIPSGGRTVRHMIFHEPSDSVWFGTDANTIARARLAQ